MRLSGFALVACLGGLCGANPIADPNYGNPTGPMDGFIGSTVTHHPPSCQPTHDHGKEAHKAES
jgi:hypothetical protein